MIAPRHSSTLESECNILGQSIVDKKTYTVDLMLLASQSKYFVLTPSAQYNVDDENLPFPAIRCGEPEDIMNGILERKCQVLYSISTSISIISTSTTLSTMSFLIALPWRSDHSTWYFQTFGCRISYACEPGYQLLGRTHRSKPCFSLSSLSYVWWQIRYFFSPQMCQPSVPLFFVKFQRWKIPKSRALVASAFKKGFPTLICQIVRQTRLEIFPKLPNSPGIYGHGGNLFMILIPLFTINHLSSPPPPSSSSPTSRWSSSSYFRYCQADGSWSPKVLPECKRESVHHLQDRN